MTQCVGLIGHPVAHSISPIFQQAAIDVLKLDARYKLWGTDPATLPEAVAGLRQPDCWGANITIPYKEAVILLLDEIEEAAARVGAVNTIVNRNGRLHGYNTDITGFRRSLRDLGFDPADAGAVILGAGGAARAVVFALLQAKVRTVAVSNRTLERAQHLVHDLSPLAGATSLAVVAGSDLPAVLRSCRLLVNCTSVGLKGSPMAGQIPLPEDLIPTGPDVLVYDLVASPLMTPLVKAARDRGVMAVGGFTMLVLQGAASFELWTGRTPPLPVMMQAAAQAVAV